MGSLQRGLRRAPVLGLALALLLVVAPACLASTGAAANVTTPTACNDPLCVLEYGCNSGVPCKTCVTPYRLVDGVCKRCPQPECIACNTAGKCTYCIGDGDYPPTPLYSLVNGTCKAPLASKCGIGCVVCNVPPGGGKPVCSKCGNGLRVVDGQCQPVNGYNAYCIYRGEKCVGCGDAYEFRKGSCVASSPNCDIASHKYPSKCEICKKGYGAKLGYDRTTHTVLGGCVRCPSNCESCGIATTCDLCRDGFKNVNGKCEACPRFCASCSGSSPCTWCMWGYGLNKQGACVPCKDRNCGDCTYSLNSCDNRSCKEGFASVYGECVPCESPRCRYCELGPSRCRMCYPGWGGDAIGGCNVRCAKSTGEPNCTRCDISPTICEACRDGYLLYFDALGRRRCQACKVKNCKSCAFPGKCSECLEGSTLRQDGTCAPGLG